MAREAVFTVKLETDLRDAFLKEAEKTHRPASQLVREFMREFVENRRKALEDRAPGIPHDEVMGEPRAIIDRIAACRIKRSVITVLRILHGGRCGQDVRGPGSGAALLGARVFLLRCSAASEDSSLTLRRLWRRPARCAPSGEPKARRQKCCVARRSPFARFAQCGSGNPRSQSARHNCGCGCDAACRNRLQGQNIFAARGVRSHLPKKFRICSDFPV